MNTIKNTPLALVTGASRGIGRAIAETLAGAGYDLILTSSHTLAKLQDVAASLEEKYGVHSTALAADAADPSAIEKIFSSLDHLDVLVNNAGISYIGLLTDMSIEEWQSVINTNLSSCFYTSRLAIPLMLQKHSGRIINISSVSGVMGNAGQANYCASKAGVIGLTKSVAREIGSRGITVNAIAPGFIDTEMTAVLPDDVKKAMGEQIPLKRFGTTEDVAQAAVFLASDRAAYITGQVLCVDGGMAM